MPYRDKIRSYLRGELSGLESGRLESALTRRPGWLGELAAAIEEGLDWHPDMVARARALMAVQEAFAGVEQPADQRPGVRLDFLRHVADDDDQPDPRLATIEHAAVIRVTNSLLSRAVRESADVVELRPTGTGSTVLAVVDSQRLVWMTLPGAIHAQVAARLKAMAGVDTGGHGAGRAGRIKLHHRGRDVDIAVVFEPGSRGELIRLEIHRGP